MAAKKNILLRSKLKRARQFLQAERFADAAELLQQLARLDRGDSEIPLMLGVAHGRLGQPEAAEQAFRAAIALQSDNPEAQYNLGVALRDQGRFEEAVQVFREAVSMKRDFPVAWDCLAHACIALRDLDQAVEAFRSAVELEPGNAERHCNLGAALQALGHLEEAVGAYREALNLNPRLATAYDSLGSALSSQGKFEEALECYEESLRRFPANARARSNLLLTLNYLDDRSASEVFEAHQAWGRAHGRSASQPPAPRPVEGRPLRVGYVSPDFRNHSVAFFIEPLLEAHDPQEVQAVCYSTVPHPDDTTRRLMGLAAEWRDISNLDDKAAAELIREDGIDILVDLSGHTAGNRLGIFVEKPAPVQATWLGYPNTTGLPAIDYRIVDEFTDPPGQEAFHTEELVRLPGCFLCYRPLPDAPEVVPLPATSAGHITFGSFNNLSKVSPPVIELWAEIVKSVPGARLLMKNPSLTDEPTRERYYAAFEAQGLGRDRVELIGHTPSQAEHLALYGRVDIALDTFPYNGTTTTCEALWMGVPVVTLAGSRHAGRVGLSLLDALGRPKWAAGDAEDYVRIAAELAADLERLAGIRASLRQDMAASPLCDAASFARRMESAFQEMHRRALAPQEEKT